LSESDIASLRTAGAIAWSLPPEGGSHGLSLWALGVLCAARLPDL